MQAKLSKMAVNIWNNIRDDISGKNLKVNLKPRIYRSRILD